MISFRLQQRFYAAMLILGAGLLLTRTIIMLSQNALNVLVSWVSLLLIIEMLIDVACIITSVNWFIANNPLKSKIPLRLAAIAAIFHAFRVLVFVLGRVGPWIDFDVRPEHRALHHLTWTWTGVYFAAIMSILGLIGVFIIWLLIKRHKSKHKDGSVHLIA